MTIITVAAAGSVQLVSVTQRIAFAVPPRELNMTASFSRKLHKAGLVLAVAISLSALSSSPVFAFSAEDQQMCTGDAFKFCSAEIPNIPAITACMYKHRAQLSVGCRAVMDRDLAADSKKMAESK